MSASDKSKLDADKSDTGTPEEAAPDAAKNAPDESIIAPIAASNDVDEDTPFKGRLADKLAAIIAAAALGLSLLLAALFFIGFIVNDYHSIAVLSAFAFSVFLASFAVIPLAIITVLARKAYRKGGSRGLYAWCLFLIIPWCALAVLWLIYTPLPVWMCSLTVLFAAILMLWALISFYLEFKDRPRASA